MRWFRRQAQLDKAINPFMVMNELEEGLSHHSLITDEELKKEYKELLNRQQTALSSLNSRVG